jgi:cold shock CspA family protein
MIGTITRAAGEQQAGTIELSDGQAITFLELNLSRDLADAGPGTQVEFDLEEEGLDGGPQAFNIRQVH